MRLSFALCFCIIGFKERVLMVRLRDTQAVYIDAVKNTIDMRVSDEELERRRKAWVPREPKVKHVRLLSCHGSVRICCGPARRLVDAGLASCAPALGRPTDTPLCFHLTSQGTLWKYTKLVSDASHGAITDGA